MVKVRNRIPNFKDMDMNVFTLSFKGDIESNALFEMHHEENCNCGDVKLHEDIFYIASNIINSFHEKNSNTLSLTYNGIEYQAIIK